MRINSKQSLYESFQTNLKESEYYYKQWGKGGVGEIDYIEFDDEWEAQNYAEKVNKETGNETAVYRMDNDECIAVFDAKDKVNESVSQNKVNLKEVYKYSKNKRLNETTGKGIQAKKDDLFSRIRQTLKDAGDKNWENIVSYKDRLPKDVADAFDNEEEELWCIEMIHSILTYSSNRNADELINDKYLSKYIDRLGKDKVMELLKNEIEEFNNATIIQDVYTDSEGVTYNSVKFKDDKLGESYAIVNYYDNNGDPKEKICNGNSPKSVEAKVKRIADKYEIVDIHQASSDVADSEYLNSLGKGVLRCDYNNRTFEESNLKEAESKHSIPDYAKECIENGIYDSRGSNIKSAMFKGNTLVVESRDEMTEEIFDKIAKTIESYFDSYGVESEGGIEDEGNKVLAIDCYMTEEGYKEYLANEDSDDTLVIDGREFNDVSDAKAWLDEKLAEYGNTYWFKGEDKATLEKLIEKFGNTYFWK